MLNNKFLDNYYDVFTTIYTNYNNNQNYIENSGKTYIYNFYNCLLSKKKFKEFISGSRFK